MTPFLRAVLFVLAATPCFAGLRSQCDLVALPGDPVARLVGDVEALTTWDPDGLGPLPQCLVAAGSAAVAGGASESVVLWNGSAWITTNAPFERGFELTVWNGRLIAAGGWSGPHEVWSFDGTTWSQLGDVYDLAPGFAGTVRAMIAHGGALVVAGSFTGIELATGTVAANNVARWNGSTWSALGAGPSLPAGSYAADVYSATVFNDVLWVGLGYSDASSIYDAGGVQVWNGSAWVVVGAADRPVKTLAARIGTALTNSFVFAGGPFTTMNGVASAKVVRFTPTTNSWTAIGTPPSTSSFAECQQLYVRATGISSYEVAAVFRTSGQDKAWRWTGPAWVPLPNLDDFADVMSSVRLAFHGGRYVVGVAMVPTTTLRGFLHGHDSATATWTPLTGPGIDGQVRAVCHDGAQLVIGGDFHAIAGTAVNHVARGSAGSWQPLGSGFAGTVNAIVRMPNGDLVAAGAFTALGDGTPMSRIARWNGTSWSPVGGGVDAEVHALLVLPNGDLVAGGSFTFAGGSTVSCIARWNGAAWLAYGAGCNADVRALLRLANGNLVAAGSFTAAGGQIANRVAQWNGVGWASIGTGFDQTVHALAEGRSGLVAGGSFHHASGWPCKHLARWNVDTGEWLPTVSAEIDRPVLALATLPGGEIAVGGAEFWLPNIGLTSLLVLRNGLQSLHVFGPRVNCLAMDTSGSLLAGGEFTSVGITVSGNVANILSTCPASATSAAPGCPSSGGANTLAAVTLPWVNGTLRTRATGLPAHSIALVLTSVSPVVPALPLSLLFAEGVPGCNLHVVPDILQLAVAAGGAAQAELFLPPTPPIVGVSFHQQMIPIEYHPATGTWLAITATNALQLVAGSF